MTLTQEYTLRALRSLSPAGPTVGAIALRAGLSWAQVQRDLIALKAEGLVIELEREKSDGFAIRYLPTAEGQLH